MADSTSNGRSIDEMGHPPMETAIFKIGGRELKIGALTLWDMEQSKDDLNALNPDITMTEYAIHVVNIIVHKLHPDDPRTSRALAETLKKSCSLSEMRGLVASMGELWRISIPEEMSADPLAEGEVVSDGIGTSIESSPNLQFAEFALETQT